MKHSLFFAVIVAVVLAARGGNEDYTPKPHAYMRIDMPSHECRLQIWGGESERHSRHRGTAG